jgi:hypothetical protein
MAGEPIGRIFRERNAYVRNRAARYAEDSVRYGNEWVAYSADGSQVLAHDKDMLVLGAAVDALGIGPENFVVAWVPSPDEDHLP